MSDQEGSLDASGWDTTEERYIEIERADEQYTDSLLRHYNDLDVAVTVNLYGTTTDDATYDGEWTVQWNRQQELPGGTADGSSQSSGAIDYDTLSDDWEFLRIGVVPDTNPNSGSFTEVGVHRSHE